MFATILPQSIPVRLRLLEFVFAIPVTVLLAIEEWQHPLHWGIIIVWFSAFVSLFSLLLSRYKPLTAGPHRRYSAVRTLVAISDLIAAIALLVWFVLQVRAICIGREVAPGYFASLMLGYGCLTHLGFALKEVPHVYSWAGLLSMCSCKCCQHCPKCAASVDNKYQIVLQDEEPSDKQSAAPVRREGYHDTMSESDSGNGATLSQQAGETGKNGDRPIGDAPRQSEEMSDVDADEGMCLLGDIKNGMD